MVSVRFLLVLLAAAVVSAIMPNTVHKKLPHTLPEFAAAGSAFEIGFAIGSNFKSQFHEFIDTSDLASFLLPFYETDEGRAIVDNFLKTLEATFPLYIDELRGMALGAEIDFIDVFLLNIEDEITLYTQADQANTTAVRSCSDILLGSHSMFGHNEDGGTDDIGHLFLQTANFNHGSGLLSYVFLTYPLNIAGNAVGINSAGVTLSSNSVFPRNLDLNGIPYSFLSRDAINAVSVEDAIARVTAHSCASGFSLNVGSTASKKIVNIEIAPFKQFSIINVTEYSYHFNEYLRLNVSQFPDPSSDHRLARVEQLPTPSNGDDILNILGDTEDHEYPIYRDGAAPDLDAVTLVSSLLDLELGEWHVFAGQNPKLNKTPLLTIPIPSP